MNIIRVHWTKDDIKDFQEYLISFSNKEKIEWAKNILKTNMPVLCLSTSVIKQIINDIYKGNYLEFLDLMIWEYYENTAINGYLISFIKDFKVAKKYLDIYSSQIDNWASCDLVTYNVLGNEKEFFDLALSYVKSEKPFVRRMGISILFNFIDDEHIDTIFKVLDCFKEEEHYYVNMINAWILCECFIKQKEKTIKYLDNHNLNKFTINKGIQKCRDSYRVSQEDKDMLLKYKVKKNNGKTSV